MTTLKELRELAKLRELSDAATPGPWVPVPYEADRERWFIETRYYDQPFPVVARHDSAFRLTPANAAFIAGAVNCVRSLLQEGEQVAQPAELPGE